MDSGLVAALVIACLASLAALVPFFAARTQRLLAARAEAGLAEARGSGEALREQLAQALRERERAVTQVENLLPYRDRLAQAEVAIRNLEADLAARESRAEAEAQAHVARIADLTRLRGEMERDFQALAQAAFGENRQSFLALADEVFKKHRVETAADVEARRRAVEDLVRPIGETLARTEAKLAAIEKERGDHYGQLTAHLAIVGQEAARLTRALRSNPGTRGRWGEESLRNALELAGLSAHCDFELQKTFNRGDERLRPDCVIRLPGNRHIVVDAKTSLEAYLDACEAEDAEEREACLRRHADDLRRHMVALARKDYAEAIAREFAARPDFVAMYVPGENFFAAAIERNGTLFEEGIRSGVFIVTPTTLIALAKAIALGWQQESIAENARAIADLGRELYKRLAVMGEHVARLGRELEGSVKSYNSFVGSLESSVMPQVRRFRDLSVPDGGRRLEALAPVQLDVREPVRSRDLLFEPAREEGAQVDADGSLA